MQEYIFGKYKIQFQKEIQFKIDSCESYIAITFYKDGNGYCDNAQERCEIINNYYMGYRLFISNKQGWHDLPLRTNTLKFIPEYLTVKELL